MLLAKYLLLYLDHIVAITGLRGAASRDTCSMYNSIDEKLVSTVVSLDPLQWS
jgi:hypothetical protein